MYLNSSSLAGRAEKLRKDYWLKEERNLAETEETVMEKDSLRHILQVLEHPKDIL